MALSLDELNATTREFWLSSGAADNFYKSNVLIYRLQDQKRTINGGKKIRQPIWHGGPRGGAFGASTKFDTTKQQKINAADFDWTYYYEPETYDITDASQNNGVAQEVDIIMTKLDMMQKALAYNMGTDIYGVGGTNASGDTIITGLRAMINSTTSTSYGSIAQDDLAVWGPGYLDTTTEGLTLNIMRAIKRGCKVGDTVDDRPTIYITTDTLRDKYESLLQPQQRIANAELGSAGFAALEFDLRPVVPDQKCPSGFLFALNENYLQLVVHQDFDFVQEPWMRPTNQWAYTTQLIWAGNLTCKRREAHGYHSNLS